MKVKCQTLVNNNVLLFINKCFRYFGYTIVLIGNINTGLVENLYIDKK